MPIANRMMPSIASALLPITLLALLPTIKPIAVVKKATTPIVGLARAIFTLRMQLLRPTLQNGLLYISQIKPHIRIRLT